MGFKTLIIVDNSNTLTTLNREIIKETVKYIIKNVSENDSIALAVTGENAEYLCEYDDSLSTKLKCAEDMRFVDVNASMTDVLMDVLINWKKDDLAMRDIIVISGSDITSNSEYTLEELFYEIGSKDFPVYTLTCRQDDNSAAIKTIASLSRISGAASLDVTDAKEEADVEKQLGDKLLAALNSSHELYEKTQSGYEDENIESGLDENTYDTTDEKKDSDEHDAYEQDISDNKAQSTEYTEMQPDYSGGEIQVEHSSNMIYQLPDKTTGISKFLFFALFIIIIAAVICIIFKRKSNKEKEEEERYLRRVTPASPGSIDISERLPFENIGSISDTTMNLQSLEEDSPDTGTRLLYQSREGVEITLEDRANPTKYFRLCVRDSIVIGRNPKFSDVCIDYDDSVSSKHCEFYLRSGNVYVRDLNSSNGTMINQQKIYQEVKLESGDVLRIGRLSFFVQILGGVNG